MIHRAVEILRRGGLVAFATETVYGLGADATNASAVALIFAAKGRPSTNPLIVHVADAQIARRYVTDWPKIADRLAEHFWPGPLTIVLPKSDKIPAEVTAGRMTVGLRVPNHPMALALLREFDGPVAAPSANRANHISPTRAEDVRAELGDAVDLILDGGPCTVGIESTVIDLTGEHPRILRPGGINREQIEAIIGPVDLFEGSVETSIASASPGQHHRHYSPITPAFRFERSQRDAVIGQMPGAVMIVGHADVSTASIKFFEMPNDPQLYARQMYQTLREIDATQPMAIYVEMPPDEPRWFSVRDRLKRATMPCKF